MSVSGVGSTTTLTVQALVDMRARLDDLQRQLGTGKKAETYAGVGLDRGLAVGLRAQLSALGGFGDSITNVGVRLDLAQTALGRIADIGRSVKSAIQLTPYQLDNTGQTSGQKSARAALDETLGLLNTQAGDRYLFSGRASDRPAVESTEHILNGDGTRAGFTQVLAERNQADLGANGLGRLVIPAAAGTTVSVSEDVAGSPFGFKLAGVDSTLANATVTGPTGSPPAISVDFAGGNPNAGETIKVSLTLPDGSTQDVTLAATTSATPGPNEFTIGATGAATAANLQAALAGAIGKLARTSLAAASAIAAGNDFFNVDAANPPRRVAGPPFDTATALVAGTSANTVTWYTGEAGSYPARATAGARVDQAITVAYGARANEQGIRWMVQNMAVFAATTFSPSDPDGSARYSALTQRLGPALDVPPGVQKVEDIQAELASAQTTMADAKDRHRQTQSALEDMLQQIEGVSQEQVAAEILALQTRLQASLQTTARLYQTSLVNYL
jgi:flagellar hook-associated protein 3 FlgL